jgi:TonB-linked SusC/RagA family outer membrane protein
MIERKKLLYYLKFGLVFLIAYFFSSAKVFAQENEVSGSIVDLNTGTPLIGATILIKGTTDGTVTDIEGNFTMKVNPNDVLVVSYIGYLTEEITYTDQLVLSLELVPDIANLEQVIVIGYGTQKRKLATGASVHVGGDDLVNSNSTRVENSLQGLTPGVVIVQESGQPGSDYNITIRGLGSVNGSEPLILIDGVPGDLNMLNPSDIESVDILKDAASAAIYGSRASDGVILVTTKKGSSGKNQLTYNFSYGVSNIPKMVDLLNGKEYAMVQNEIEMNRGREATFSEEYINSLGEETNWLEEISLKNAPSQNHYLNLSGGNNNSVYSMSLSYSNEQGIINFNNKSNYERYSFRINSEHKVHNYLKIGENLTYIRRYRKGLGVDEIYSNIMRTALSANPLIPVYDENVYDGFGRSDYINDQVNPIAIMNYEYNTKHNYDDIIGNIYAELELIKGLKFRTDFGGKLNLYNSINVSDTFTITEQYTNELPDLDHFMERKFGYNWDNTLTFQKSFGKHNVLAMIGSNAQDNWEKWLLTEADAFMFNPKVPAVISNIELRPDLAGDTLIVTGDDYHGISRYSYFGRISYNYDEIFMFSASLRRDVSSLFGKDNRVGYFPAFSGGWVISRMDFLASSSWLNFMKIRASFGANGKEPFKEHLALATVGTENRVSSFGSGWQTGVSPNIMANPNLKWETSKQYDFGIDTRFLNYFSFNIDLYKKISADWIIPIPTASISGSAGISGDLPYDNRGNVVNKGIEIEFGFNKSIRGVQVSANANLGYNKNEASKVPGEILPGSNSVLFNGSQIFYRVQEGYPIGYFWGYKADGLFQTLEDVEAHKNSEGELLQSFALPGDVRRVDENEDGEINDEDKVMLGNPHPDVVAGLNFSAAYRGFDFSIYLSGAFGHQIVKCYRSQDRPWFNYTADFLDRWQWNDINENGIVDVGEGTSNTVPRITGAYDRNNNWRNFSDLYVEDADYVRIKSLNLGYDLMTLFNKENLPFGQFRVYVAATNLLTITKYSGLDPEVGYSPEADPYASGIDLGFYPTARTYLFGVNVNF